jgi:aspartyl/asparaginyl beta-hydroxylase (cupin superfamily)
MHLDEADKQKLVGMLSEAKKRYGPASLERLEEAFAIAVGSKQPITPEDPARAGTGFFYPGLSAKPWHDTANFPMCAKLEQSWEAIREEMKNALEHRRGFQQFLRRGTDLQTGPDAGVPKEWKALYLKEHTEEFPENRLMCPETLKIVADEPRLENYVFFSALDPGGFIARHHATYNWVLNIHLGLIIPDTRPEICGVRVKDQAKGWVEGKTHVFDSSFEHEAWNNADSTRFILIITTYHPELTDIEVSLLKRVNVDLAKAEDVKHDHVLREAEKELEGEKWWV